MLEFSAKDLPDLSVVANPTVAYIKNHPTATAQWRGTNGGYFGNWRIDEELACGATVLRHGDGSEGDQWFESMPSRFEETDHA
jgi:hypothetical protein